MPRQKKCRHRADGEECLLTFPFIGPFSDQIPTAHRPHLCRMHGPGRNIAAASHSIRVRPAVHDQYHLAAQYDVCGLRVMRMLRIKRVRLILPNIGMAKSLALQLLRQLSLVQTRIPPFVEGSVPSVLQPFTLSSQLRRQHFASKHGYAPSALMGADAERACRLQERRS
jgi:hypothetical protein